MPKYDKYFRPAGTPSLDDEEDLKQKKKEELWEKENKKKLKELALTTEIEGKYNSMIRAILTGESKPNEFLGFEKLDYTPEEYANLMLDKSFNMLIGKKKELREARESAVKRNREMKALAKTTGKSVDLFNFDKIFKEMSEVESKEYIERFFFEEESVEPHDLKPEIDRKVKPKKEEKEPETETEPLLYKSPEAEENKDFDWDK
ncbi:MAG: hypothetical protein ACKKMW_02100 [Candidatus Nealsonbacteria bacterium]